MNISKSKQKVFNCMDELEKEYMPNMRRERLRQERIKEKGYGYVLAEDFIEEIRRINQQ